MTTPENPEDTNRGADHQGTEGTQASNPPPQGYPGQSFGQPAEGYQGDNQQPAAYPTQGAQPAPPYPGPSAAGQYPQGQYPQGQAPQGAYGQVPQGQPYAGPPVQGAYPAAGQPGQPYAGQPYPGQPYPGQPVPGPAPAKPSKTRTWIVLGIVGVLVIAGVIAGLLSFNVSATKVGDCLAQDGTDSVKSVQCDSADADYQVVGVIPDTNQPIRGLSNPCEDFSDATSYYWEGREGSSGTLLCLKEL